MPRFFDPSAGAFDAQGPKQEPAPAQKSQPLLQARKTDHPAASSPGDVTYCVLDTPVMTAGKDRREPPRKRTRLRCGKILDRNGKFLIECQVHDRTIKGAHLRLMSPIALPRRIKYFDDEQRTLVEAEIVWRKQAEIGVHFLTKPNAQAVNLGMRSTAAGKYYAIS